jgi:hypothetical protein
MMNSAGLTSNMRARVWAESAATATLLENVMPTSRQHGVPVKRFHGEQYKWFKNGNLHKFGECAVITTKTDTTPKLQNRGVIGMFLGYSENHSADTLRFMNIKTNRVIYSRDYKWLNKTWGQYHNIMDVEVIFENQDDQFAEDWDNISKSSESTKTTAFNNQPDYMSSDSSSSSDDDFNDYNLISDDENASVENHAIPPPDDHVLFSPSPSQHKSKG